MTDPQHLPRVIIHLKRAVDQTEQVQRLQTVPGPLTQIVRAVVGRQFDEAKVLATQGNAPQPGIASLCDEQK